MRNKLAIIIPISIFYIILGSLPASAMESLESKVRWLFHGNEGGIANQIKNVLFSNAQNPLSVVDESDNFIKTKSQPPSRLQRQNVHSFVQIEGQPSYNKECIIKKILPGQDGRVQVTDTDKWPNSVHGVVCSTFSFL